MNEERIQKLKKLKLFTDNKDLASFIELQEINSGIQKLIQKEINIEIPVNEPVEIPPVDLSETNDLLQQILNHKDEPIDISIDLKLI